MKDKRKNNGGARPNAGRKPKAEEIAIIENMDAALAPREVWEALAQRVKDGDVQAIKLWISYRVGLPKQMIDLSSSDGTTAPKSTKIVFTDGAKPDYSLLSLDEKKTLRDLVNKSKQGKQLT